MLQIACKILNKSQNISQPSLKQLGDVKNIILETHKESAGEPFS